MEAMIGNVDGGAVAVAGVGGGVFVALLQTCDIVNGA